MRSAGSMPELGTEILCVDYYIALEALRHLQRGFCGLGMKTPLFPVGATTTGMFMKAELERLGVDASLVRWNRPIRTGVTVSFANQFDRAFATLSVSSRDVHTRCSDGDLWRPRTSCRLLLPAEQAAAGLKELFARRMKTGGRPRRRGLDTPGAGITAFTSCSGRRTSLPQRVEPARLPQERPDGRPRGAVPAVRVAVVQCGISGSVLRAAARRSGADLPGY
jgi:hypothetical protein